MTASEASASEGATPIERISRLARERGLRIAVAESLTSGLLATEVGKGEHASEWFAGGVVAYLPDIKVGVLGVPEGIDPCSSECAAALAVGVRALMHADVAVSTTGIGGPDDADGHHAGTVYLGWATRTSAGSVGRHLAGPPDDVLRSTAEEALELLATLIDEGPSSTG